MVISGGVLGGSSGVSTGGERLLYQVLKVSIYFIKLMGAFTLLYQLIINYYRNLFITGDWEWGQEGEKRL